MHGQSDVHCLINQNSRSLLLASTLVALSHYNCLDFICKILDANLHCFLVLLIKLYTFVDIPS